MTGLFIFNGFLSASKIAVVLTHFLLIHQIALSIQCSVNHFITIPFFVTNSQVFLAIHELALNTLVVPAGSPGVAAESASELRSMRASFELFSYSFARSW